MKTTNDQIKMNTTSDDREFTRLVQQIAESPDRYQNRRVHMMAAFNEIRRAPQTFPLQSESLYFIL